MSEELEDPIPPFESYALEIDGTTYTVLEPEDATAQRVQTPGGQVVGVPVADSSEALTAEALAAHLSNPPQTLATPAQIKAEAHRRILEIVPMWKQINLTAAALDIKTKDSPTAEDTATLAAIQAIWDRVVSIRAYSDTLEANPPPVGQLRAQNWPT